ncbi:MAG: glutathione S-transferase family protein [Pseudomonadales bacterium]|nr:glutathione S-transferase family protein [Gammaproteobacteria bacterium]NNL56767.1 glutathione S-transferase family protein [Pseudomonadales bacterium]
MYQGEYALVGSEMSFFTRKLEAQLRFQRIPWHWQFKTQQRSAELEARAGTHFIPLLMTPDNWLIHDTIALGPMLNDRHTEYKVLPDTPLQRASSFILEDAFNHWLGRSCIHSRWCYPENVDWVGPRFAANLMLDRSIDEPFSEQELEQFKGVGPMMYENFGKNVCEYNGVGPQQSEAVKSDFALMLDALGKHFAHNNFLLGPRPCPADFALAGASKAHYICDPEPISWLGEHRQMLFDYTERFFSDEPIAAGNWLADDQVPETLPIVLDYVQRSYLPFATANIAAGLAGEKYYEYDYGFGPTKARTQKRLNKARLHVQDELRRLDAENNAGIVELYGSRGMLQHYIK